MPTIRKSPQSIEYVIHPQARDVFRFMSERCKPIFHWETFPDPLKSALLQQQQFVGIMYSEQIPKSNSDETIKKAIRFEFISPVWALKYTEQLTPPPENFLVCYEPDELTDHQISLMSWSSVFQLLAFSVDRRILSNVWDGINEMVPVEILEELLSAKSLTLDVITAWTGGSKATIINQKQKEKQNIAATQSHHYSEQEMLSMLTGNQMD